MDSDLSPPCSWDALLLLEHESAVAAERPHATAIPSSGCVGLLLQLPLCAGLPSHVSCSCVGIVDGWIGWLDGFSSVELLGIGCVVRSAGWMDLGWMGGFLRGCFYLPGHVSVFVYLR